MRWGGTACKVFLPPVAPPAQNMPRLSTFRQSTANCINLLLGIGLLSYPYVLRLSGWVPGICSIILMARNGPLVLHRIGHTARSEAISKKQMCVGTSEVNCCG